MPVQPRPTTLHSGQVLKSSDFGSSSPVRAEIKGLGLPPPTELIRVPKRVRSAETVLMQLVEQPTIGMRAERVWDRGKKLLVRAAALSDVFDGVWDHTFGWATTSEGRARMRVFTYGAVRSCSMVAVAWSKMSAQGARRLYRDMRAAMNEGYEQAADLVDDEAAASPPRTAHCALAADSALRPRATLSSEPVFDLSKGTVVTVYPNHDAPIGWVLAQGPEGDIGFLPVDHLELCTPAA